MNYDTKLLTGQFLKRYKRFFADVNLDGKVVVAHVPNTGSLKGVCDRERPCRLAPSTNPERKLKFTLEQVEVQEDHRHSWVGVNTHRANDLAWEAWQNNVLPHWINYVDGSREVKINAETRLDFKFIGAKGNPHFVEVKSVTLAREDLALFPDAETTRGQKHIRELMKLKNEGATCEILFVVQRTDCQQFSPAVVIDPEYARLLYEAHQGGLKITAVPVRLSETSANILNEKLQLTWP